MSQANTKTPTVQDRLAVAARAWMAIAAISAAAAGVCLLIAVFLLMGDRPELFGVWLVAAVGSVGSAFVAWTVGLFARDRADG